MSGRQSNLTSKEIEDLQNLVTETLTSVYAMADKLATFEKVASVQNYKTNHTNADRIRNMSDEELAEFLITFKNTFGEEYEGEASCMDWLQSEVE